MSAETIAAILSVLVPVLLAMGGAWLRSNGQLSKLLTITEGIGTKLNDHIESDDKKHDELYRDRNNMNTRLTRVEAVTGIDPPLDSRSDFAVPRRGHPHEARERQGRPNQPERDE